MSTEQQRWENLMSRLEGCLVFGDWGRYLAGTPQSVWPQLGILEKNASTKIWFNITRNQHTSRLRGIGAVMNYHSDAFSLPLQYIREYGFGPLFNLPVDSPSVAPGSGRAVNWSPPINSWTDLTEFRALLKKLGYQLSHRMQNLALVTQHAIAINWYGCEANWESWFFSRYNLQGIKVARIIGDIIMKSGEECNVVRQQIQQSAYADLFFGQGLPVFIEIPQSVEVPQMKTASADSVDQYFTRGNFVTAPDVEISTVNAILQRTADTPMLKALRSERFESVKDMLVAFPELLPLVGIALIRSGNCSPYSPVAHPGQQIIQYKISEEQLCQTAISRIVDGFPLKTLANFLGSPKDDEKNWRNLFHLCDAEQLKEILVQQGKKRAELDMWDSKTLIAYMATWAEKLGFYHRTEYKLKVLRFLRARQVPSSYTTEVTSALSNMLPWLDSDELIAWLNPKKVSVADIMIVDDEPEEVELGPLEAFFKTANVTAPAFIQQFKAMGFVYEDLPLVIEGFNDPGLAEIRGLLTMPQKLALKRNWKQ